MGDVASRESGVQTPLRSTPPAAPAISRRRADRGSGGSSRIGKKDSASRGPAATALFRMPAPAPPPEPETTIDSLPIELLSEEVFLRVRTPAALVRVAATKRSWRDAIAKDGFLARYRKRHKSSPFLGLYVPRPSGGRPWFQSSESIRFCRDDGRHLYAARNRAYNFGEIRRYQDHRLPDADAFIPGPLGVPRKDSRLLDGHNGRLLLTRGNEAMEVRSPLARETILLPFPPDFHRFPDYLEACTCLLQGHDGSAFRVVYLQHQHPRPVARAVEYDSTRKTWHTHPWEILDHNIRDTPGAPQEVMHAGHRIFCTYYGLMSAALMLDTRNMEFSLLPLPCDRNFTIGEGEDNTCCLVEYDCCQGHRLRVWQLDEEKLVWDLNKDINLYQLLAEEVGCERYRPRAISNGTALLCSECTEFHFVLDLDTCSVKDNFRFPGHVAYLMHMPWPPAFSSSPTTNGAGSPGRSPIVEGNMSVGSPVLASAGCDAPLQGSIRENANKTSNEEKYVESSPEICVRSKDQDIDDTHEGLSQQNFCIKCGKDGELLTCSECSLAAHDICFGPSVTFEEDLFYCPVCSCNKAKEDCLKKKKAYLEAIKNAVAFVGRAQVSKQHDEQLNGVQPGAAKRDGHSNGSDMSKRNSIYQNEAYDLAHRDEEPHQPRKKQKINAGGNGYPKEVLTEKAPFQNSGTASMNKHSVLQNNRKMRVEDPEKKQQEGDKEARKEAGKRRKKSSVHRQKRYSNPVGPVGRRKNLPWTEKEAAGLREAMEKFAPQNGAQIPWTEILEYGSNVFHKTRLPDDLRVKWRSMNKNCAG